MSRWAEPIQEFSQIITPDGNVYDLHTASKKGRWIIANQGWGMAPTDWITESSPFQHGATVRDYRLQPRVIQLLLHQSFCNREDFWAGRFNLLQHLRPNRSLVAFDDFWMPRSQYQGGEIYPTVAEQTSIQALAEWGGSLYGGSGAAAFDTGGVLFRWDNGGSWVAAGYQPRAVTLTDTEYGTRINALLPATITTPIRQITTGPGTSMVSYREDDDSFRTLFVPPENYFAICQTFTAPVSFTATQIRLRLSRVGNPGQVRIRLIHAGGANFPNNWLDTANWISAPALISGNFITADPAGEWYTFDLFPASAWRPMELIEDEVYAVMFDYAYDAANYIGWRVDESGPTYAGGSFGSIGFPGDAWAMDTDVDCMFEVMGTYGGITVVGEERRDVLIVGCGNEGIAAIWDGGWDTRAGAQSHATETDILSLVEWRGDVYAGTSPNGLLLRLYHDEITGYGLWEVAADTLTADDIHALAVFDDGAGLGTRIYGGTDGGLLYRWTSGTPGTWVQVCPQEGGETNIRALKVYHGNLYGAGDTGVLFRYDVDGGAWEAVTAAGDAIFALVEYKGRLYGAGADGALYRWNNDDAWEEACGEFIGPGGAEEILSMITYQGRLFAGTQDGAYLLEYLRRMTSRQPPCITLRRVLPGGERRDLCVYLANGPQFDDQAEGWREHSFREMLRFVAYNPVMYDPDPNEAQFGNDEGELGEGSISVVENIDYDGTWQEHPTIELTGPMNEPIIINESLDEHLALNYNIPAGDVVTIDLGALTVTDNNNMNLLGAVTAESSLATWRLEPEPVVVEGLNAVRLIANGVTDDSRCVLTYYRRFIGI